MPKLLNPKTRVCRYCGKEFKAIYGSQRYCNAECYETKEIEERTSQPMRNPKRQAEPNLSLKKILKDLKEYNKANNCYLSYGQYVQMIESKKNKF